MNLRQMVTDLYDYACAALAGSLACFNMLFVLAVRTLVLTQIDSPGTGPTRQAILGSDSSTTFPAFISCQ